MTLTAIIALSSCQQNIRQAYPEISVKRGSGYSYAMTSTEARKQLYGLARKSYKEDSWLIYNGRVYDIGTKESMIRSVSDIEKIRYLLKTDPPKGKQIIWAHIHPMEMTGDKYVIPPSPEDWVSLAKLQRLLNNEFGINVKSWVVDYGGVWEMTSGEEFFSDMSTLSQRINQAVFDIKFKLIYNKRLSKHDIANKIIALTRKKTGIKMAYNPVEP